MFVFVKILQENCFFFRNEIVRLNIELKKALVSKIKVVKGEDLIPVSSDYSNINELNKFLDKYEQDLRELNNNQKNLYLQFNQVVELEMILSREDRFFLTKKVKMNLMMKLNLKNKELVL